jgi:hypothetical protein
MPKVDLAPNIQDRGMSGWFSAGSIAGEKKSSSRAELSTR